MNSNTKRKNKTKKKDSKPPEIKKLRCINIDCVFNSSNEPDQERNTCNHPNLIVDSKSADITIAICSEFRSKKDYIFNLPDKLIEIKTNSRVEIKGAPDPGLTKIEKVTTEELEKELVDDQSTEADKTSIQAVVIEQKTKYSTPTVIKVDDGEDKIHEPLLTTDKKYSDFQILKRFYRPYMKRGIIVSIFTHLIIIWFLYAFVAEKNSNQDRQQQQQRIVVIEDIEEPKFDPPDVDKEKEVEKKTSDNLSQNKSDVRPIIKPKSIIPKIKRPKDVLEDTSLMTKNKTLDSLKAVTDSLLALKNTDTNRLVIPDSLKNFIPENEIGMKLWYPKNWKLRDNRDVNLNLNQFKGVILNTDSLSEDPGAVTLFIQIDDPKHSTYNKTTYKNIFAMDDSTIVAYSTDPQLTGANRIAYKFFIFNDPTGNNNVFVNSEIKKEMFEKYRKYIDAIVRSIKVVTKTPGAETKNK